MKMRVVVGALLVSATAVATVAAVAPSRKAVAVYFRRPTIVVSTLIQGNVVFEHDDARMARGEPCTTVYQFDVKRKIRGEKLVEFMCTPHDREVVKKFEAICSKAEGAGPDRLVEYQFEGDTEGHGVPYY